MRLTTLAFFLMASTAMGNDRYVEKFKDLKAQPVQSMDVYDMPVLLWGADVSTLVANGGVTTTPNSIFGKMGLKYKIVGRRLSAMVVVR